MSQSSRTILILGGSPFQIPVIRYARSAGYHVVTCDYLPGNPGHEYAHEYHNVSTTDMDGVLALARDLHVHGILAYASDPAAATAAYVGNRLGLPSNPYESVRVLTNKDLYRDFLRGHGFTAPRAWTIAVRNGELPAIPDVPFPVMVKPVDSSGSKGVSRITSREGLGDAIQDAARFSRAGRIIFEEYVVREGPQIGGEAFVLNGKLVFMCLGDQIVDVKCNPYVPAGMLFPSRMGTDLYARIASDLQRLLDLLDFSFGGLNLEIMVDKERRLYLMEVGPRTGGNFLPELMNYCAGADIAKYSVESALGHEIPELSDLPASPRCDGFFAYGAIHSRTAGILRSVRLSEEVQSHVLEMHQFKYPGDQIEAYNGSNCTIGILLLGFDTRRQMEEMISGMSSHIAVDVGCDAEASEK